MVGAYKLIVSPQAQSDLKKIYAYGVGNWGKDKASNYLDNLKQHFWKLTELPKIGVEREVVLPGIRSVPINSHVLFYRLQKQKIEVVRVLHRRQDPQRHI